MRIVLVEPFFSGSHRRWALELQSHSQHQIQILSLPGRHWKWRMYGGAVSLAEEFNQLDYVPDLILASDMLDLTTFLALTRQNTSTVPVAVYFHENQITYPWSPTDADVPLQRNNQYGFLNYTSALAADRLFFNSNYHRQSFLTALPDFLRQFPDYRSLDNIHQIEKKSTVLSLGMDLKKFDTVENSKAKSEVPVILWNHRWEYDKRPTEFFEALFHLQEEGIDFRLIVTGENYKKAPKIFKEAQSKLQKEILHFGYAEDFEEYASLLHQADLLAVTSNQDFFGGSVVEAIYCDCYPLLPQRLAYPEHIPESKKKAHLYSEAHFLPKLKEVLHKIQQKEVELSFRDYTKQYDWSNLIEQYDKAFADLLS